MQGVGVERTPLFLRESMSQLVSELGPGSSPSPLLLPSPPFLSLPLSPLSSLSLSLPLAPLSLSPFHLI